MDGSNAALIQILGRYPAEVRELVRDDMPENVELQFVESEPRSGFTPPSPDDIASIASALSATVTLALNLWDRAQRHHRDRTEKIELPATADPAEETKKMNQQLRDEGLFRTQVIRVSDTDSGLQVKLTLADSITHDVRDIEVSFGGDSATIHLK
jgi:hypothetical protein